MFWNKIKKNYVSELDNFFRSFDKNRKILSAARLAEVEKHKKIFEKRDNPTEDLSKSPWKDFYGLGAKMALILSSN